MLRLDGYEPLTVWTSLGVAGASKREDCQNICTAVELLVPSMLGAGGDSRRLPSRGVLRSADPGLVELLHLGLEERIIKPPDIDREKLEESVPVIAASRPDFKDGDDFGDRS